MSTTITEQRHRVTAGIAELMRDRPDHDTPPAERQTWMQRKIELLAAAEAVEADR